MQLNNASCSLIQTRAGERSFRAATRTVSRGPEPIETAELLEDCTCLSHLQVGNTLDADNYHQVSLTSALCKVLENMIKERLRLLLDRYSQHNVRARRSCLSNLLTVVDSWNMALTNRQTVDAVSVDLRKAFDMISHCKWLVKLRAAGV